MTRGVTCRALNLLGVCGAVGRLVSDGAYCLLLALKTKELQFCQVTSLKYGRLSALGQTQKQGVLAQPAAVTSCGDAGASARQSGMVAPGPKGVSAVVVAAPGHGSVPCVGLHSQSGASCLRDAHSLPRSILRCCGRDAGPWPGRRELLPQLMLGLVLSSSAVFEEPEDPSNRSFFSEIISSISDVKFSHSGRYIMTRDYLTVKVWDLNMENRPIETYQVSVARSDTRSDEAPAVLLPEPCSWAGSRGDGDKPGGWKHRAVKSWKANKEL